MNIYGVRELAQEVGVTPVLMAQWVKRGRTPEPTERLACGPVWIKSAALRKWISGVTRDAHEYQA